jgi:hypothetical protein
MAASVRASATNCPEPRYLTSKLHSIWDQSLVKWDNLLVIGGDPPCRIRIATCTPILPQTDNLPRDTAPHFEPKQFGLSSFLRKSE